MSDLVTRLRTWVHAVHAVPVSDLLEEAADEIERLRGDARYWQHAAQAWETHAGDLRVMLMELRNGAPERCETVSLSDENAAG